MSLSLLLFSLKPPTSNLEPQETFSYGLFYQILNTGNDIDK